MGLLKTKQKSILFIGNFLSSDGGNRGVSEDLAERLIDKGWHVVHASSHNKRVVRLLNMVTTAISHQKQYQVANIDVFSGKSFIWAEIMGGIFSLLNKPYVCTLRGGNLAVFDGNNHNRVKRLLHLAKKVVTPSKFLKSYFSTTRTDIYWVPNGIELSRYTYIQRENIAPKIIWLRAFHNIYAPTMAVEVLHCLQGHFADACLTMVGPDKGDGTLQKVQQLIEKYNLQNNIKIVGGVDKKEVPYWLNQGDIFINTTRIESFGVSVVEAAACGLPIVTTNAGELPFLWDDGVDALVVPMDNAQAMADAVQRILTEPGLARTLSINGRIKAAQFDWLSIFPQWEKLFESLIDNDQHA